MTRTHRAFSAVLLCFALPFAASIALADPPPVMAIATIAEMESSPVPVKLATVREGKEEYTVYCHKSAENLSCVVRGKDGREVPSTVRAKKAGSGGTTTVEVTIKIGPLTIKVKVTRTGGSGGGGTGGTSTATGSSSSTGDTGKL